MNRKARPVKYQSARDYIAANFASRTMRWTGIIVVLFLDLAPRRPDLGHRQPDFVRGAAYDNVDASLSRLPVALLYIVANLALGIHLFHGTWSLFQSIGLNNPRFNAWRRVFAAGFAAIIVVGNVSFPIAVLAGVIDFDPEAINCGANTTERHSDRHARDRRGGTRSMSITLDSKIPAGPLADKWTNYKFDRKLVNPANRRKYDIIVVGTGLAGAAAAATLGEQGYNVKAFTFHDSPRRAHSIAAQGGINAAKNYKGDGDSVHRLFYDTVKGGDFRAREANVYRLAEESVNIIDQMTAQGVPFAREYGGLLDNRSLRRRPGQPHVLRPRPDRPAAPARRLPAARPPGRPRQRQAATTASSWSTSSSSTAARRHRRPRPAHRRGPATRPTPWCSPPAATPTSSSSRPTPWRATSPPPGGPTARARRSPTPATRRSTRPASRRATTSSRSSR